MRGLLQRLMSVFSAPPPAPPPAAALQPTPPPTPSAPAASSQASRKGAIGPGLLELDAIQPIAERIKISFHISDPARQLDTGDRLVIDTQELKQGWLFLESCGYCAIPGVPKNATISQTMLALGRYFSPRKPLFETVDVQTSKSPKTAKDLRDNVLNALAETFGRPLPPAEELNAARAAYRQKIREGQATARQQRQHERNLREMERKRHQEDIEKQIGGKVTDLATFLKALELRVDPLKITKAMKMLKAEKFQLYNDITNAHLNGVVKSQTDRDLVYACRIESTGAYCCCTQNLAICGGLRGGICKHLLVTVIGLMQSNQLDPATMDTWIANTRGGKAKLDKDKMSEIFIRYKGAEAGEIDWRPTETMPEDYYAL